MKNVTAVILGGGRGTRLYPLTLARAKPAVGLVGKYRLIDIPISNCINSAIKRIFVITQFQSASLHRHIMQTYRFDVFSDGFVDILTAEQTPQRESWFQGTADAVRATLRHITHYRPTEFVILSGDHLYRMDYSRFVKHHREMGADITLAVSPVPFEDATRMGLMRTDSAGWVEEYVEKPQDPEVVERFRAPAELCHRCGSDARPRYLASMGTYVFEPEVLESCLKDRDKLDFGREVIPNALGDLKVCVYPFSGYWEDIGTIASFFEANIALAQPDPPFPLYEPGWPIFTRERSLPPSRVIGSKIRDSLLVEGSDITGAEIADSILGVRSVVRPGSRLSEVVMLGADYYEGEDLLGNAVDVTEDVPPLGIGENCRIERAIIDKNARIGDDVVIRRQPDDAHVENKSFWIVDGVTVIPRGAVVPAGTRI